MLADPDMDMKKSDVLIGRKRTFKNSKIRNNSSIKKSSSHVKDCDQLIVPNSIQNFKIHAQSQGQDDNMSSKVSISQAMFGVDYCKIYFSVKMQNVPFSAPN